MKNFRTLYPLTAGIILLMGILACGGGGGGSSSSSTPTEFTIGGSVSGVTGDLTLQCNGGNDLVITSDGTFTFGTRFKKGTAYTVTIAGQPYRQICGITANGTGTVPGSDVTDVQVECITADVITRASVASDGTEGNSNSVSPFMSREGRYVVFTTDSSNLVAGDTNGLDDVFVHDRLTGKTTRVSVASDGTESNSSSVSPSISGNGRYVAFQSSASNLVDNDTNNVSDIFVHDRVTGETTRVSVASDGNEADNFNYSPSISGDGRYIAFQSGASNLVTDDTNIWGDVFIHDRQTGETTRVSVASDGTEGNDGSSSNPSISDDGRYIAFQSGASNLVTDDTNGQIDVFVHDRLTGETTRASVASDGTEASNNGNRPSISGDGRYVAFFSISANLVTGDTNNLNDVFVHDRQTGETTRVSVASDGTEGNGTSRYPSISGDGRYVAFDSISTNLVTGDTNNLNDVFVHDRLTGETTRVSVASDGTEGNGASRIPAISGDGRYVAFGSGASNLVVGDTNAFGDVFVAPVR